MITIKKGYQVLKRERAKRIRIYKKKKNLSFIKVIIT